MNYENMISWIVEYELYNEIAWQNIFFPPFVVYVIILFRQVDARPFIPALHGRALGLYSNFFHAPVPRQSGRGAAESGILDTQPASASSSPVSIGRPRFLQTGSQRATDRYYRRPIWADRGRHRHCTAVGRGARVRLSAGVRHRYFTTATHSSSFSSSASSSWKYKIH